MLFLEIDGLISTLWLFNLSQLEDLTFVWTVDALGKHLPPHPTPSIAFFYAICWAV